MNIFVGSLPFSIDDADLRESFEAYGTVNSVKIITDKFTGRSKGFGFVEMENDTEAEKAIQELTEEAKKDAKSILKSEFGLFKNDSTVQEYKPQEIPKEELKIHFGPATKEEFNDVKKQKKESKLKKTLQNWKDQQKQEEDEGFKVGKGGGK